MKTSIKILAKLGLLVLFIFISPLMQGIKATVKELDFSMQLFNQQKNITSIDIETFNVMDMVKKEDIPYREVDVEPDDIVEVPQQPIGSQKSIYIYSTHQQEGYKDQNTVLEASAYLGKLLREAGYEVVVEDRNFTEELNTLGLNYNQSYQISRNAITDAVMEHQGFDLMIDFHRDSVPRESSYIEASGKNYAKMMIVLGGLSSHFSNIQNQAMTLLDKTNQLQSGIMKNILVREAYYNQDISDNMLLTIGSSFMEQDSSFSIEQEIIDFENSLEENEQYVSENRGEAVHEVHMNKASELAKNSSDTIKQIVGVSVEVVTSIFKAIIE